MSRQPRASKSQNGRHATSGGRQRSDSLVSRPPTIDEEGTSQLAALRATRSSTPHLPHLESADNLAMQEITGEIGTATRKYGELLRSLECRLDAAQKKAEAAEAAAAEWKIKYETTSADMDGLQTQLDAVNRKNWELWYDLQDAQEDSKILLGYLENSIHARFQGAPGDSDHGWDNAGNLPLYSYEARLAARRLELPQPGHDRQSGLDATGDEESKEKIPAAFRRGAPNTKPAPEKEELPAQGSWDTSKGDRVSRKASGKDWEKGKPRR